MTSISSNSGNTNTNNNKDNDNIIDEDDTDYRLYKKNDNDDINNNVNTTTTTTNSIPVVPVPVEVQSSDNNKTKETAREILLKLSFYDIVVPPFCINTNSNQKKSSWILVKDGSFGGFFDWVPKYLRVGPWKVLAIVYFSCIVFATIGTGLYLSLVDDASHESNESNTKRYSIEHLVYIQQYYYSQLYTIGWYYNIIGSIWMIYIIYCIIYKSPVGIGAWTTYTVQSWSILCIRHILCCIIPFWNTSTITSIKTIVYICELIKFSCCISTTITFIIWNFFICPYIYYIILQTPIEKYNFYKFCTSFRLVNIHGLNIVLLFCNVYFSSIYNGPSLVNNTDNIQYNNMMMELQWTTDFYISIVSMVLYMSVYLLIYDRLGLHLYPIFSPRSYIFVLSWTGSLLLYVGLFIIWRYILKTISIQ